MLYKPNSVLGREAGNIRVLTVLIFREKEYFRTFASVCERPKKPTCLLVFVTNCSVLLEMRTHTQREDQLSENDNSENSGLLQSMFENPDGISMWLQVSGTLPYPGCV